ncbi:MAG: DUF3352 domain-containing protein, partial [Cyanobacteria bacterium P01_G01_bin.49]
MSSPNRSGKGYLPLVGVTALLVAGGMGVYYYFQGHLPFLSGDGLTPLEAAEVVPESAFASSYISTRPQDWKQLSQYGTPEAKQVVEKNLELLETEAFSSPEISLEKDILPWLDGVTIAFLPDQTEVVSAEDLQILLVVGIKNKVKAAQFAQKLNKQQDIKLQ